MYKSIFFLYFLQGLNYAIPLMELPLLARKLGAVNYGQLIVVQSAALMASLLVEYGFNIRSTRSVAEYKDDRALHRNIYWRVLSAKLILSFPVAISCFFLIIIFSYDFWLVFYGFLYFIAFGFSCNWYYQGVERLIISGSLDVVIRYLSLFCIFLLLPSGAQASDALMYMASFSLLSTIITNVVGVANFGFEKLSFRQGWHEIVFGFNVFLYKSSSGIMGALLPVCVGAVAGVQAVSKIASAEKIVRALVGMTSPIFMVLYPIFVRNREAGVFQGRGRIAVGFAAIGSLCAAALVFIFSRNIINFLLGSEYLEAVPVLKIFCISIFLRITSQSIAYFILLPRNDDWYAAKVSLASVVILLVFFVPMTFWFSAMGAALAMVFSDFFMLAFYFHRINKR